MAVSYRSSSNTGNSTQVTSTNPAVPAGATTNDIVVVSISRWEPGLNPAITAPSGFTHITQVIGGDAKLDLYWKRLTGSDTGSYVFSWTGLMWTDASAICLPGATTTGDPIGTNFTSATGTYGTFASLSVTTSFEPGLVWRGYNDSAGTHTPPTNYTEVVDVDSGTMAYRIPATTGAHTASGGSVTSSSTGIVFLLAIEPDAGTPPPVVEGDPPIVLRRVAPARR